MAKKAKGGISVTVKNIICAARKRQGLTQEQAGKLLGKTQEQLSYKERHILSAKLSDLLLMAECYGIDVIIDGVTVTGRTKR